MIDKYEKKRYLIRIKDFTSLINNVQKEGE